MIGPSFVDPISGKMPKTEDLTQPGVPSDIKVAPSPKPVAAPRNIKITVPSKKQSKKG